MCCYHRQWRQQHDNNISRRHFEECRNNTAICLLFSSGVSYTSCFPHRWLFIFEVPKAPYTVIVSLFVSSVFRVSNNQIWRRKIQKFSVSVKIYKICDITAWKQNQKPRIIPPIVLKCMAKNNIVGGKSLKTKYENEKKWPTSVHKCFLNTIYTFLDFGCVFNVFECDAIEISRIPCCNEVLLKLSICD